MQKIWRSATIVKNFHAKDVYAEVFDLFMDVFTSVETRREQSESIEEVKDCWNLFRELKG